MKLKASEAAEITAAKAVPIIEKALSRIHGEIGVAANNGADHILVKLPDVSGAFEAIKKGLKADGYFVNGSFFGEISVSW
jgi:uracil phosphoribosyltransferase